MSEEEAGMRECPIIFSPSMVRAIVEGQKTETRRPIKRSNAMWGTGRWRDVWNFKNAFPDGAGTGGYLKVPLLRRHMAHGWEDGCDTVHRLYPKWQSGDLLYVKERRDGRSPIFMRKADARLWLSVRSVRAARLQNITHDGAQREGFENVRDFAATWDRLYRPSRQASHPYCWAQNPWVWVIAFEVLDVKDVKE